MSVSQGETVLVTGSAGFIGAYVSKSLVAKGATVIGLDNLNDYYDVKLKEDRLAWSGAGTDYEFVRLDVCEKDRLQALVDSRGVSQIVHLAAQAGVRYSMENPEAYIDSNIKGFLSVLEVTRHAALKSLVYASSSSVYGLNTETPFKEADRVDRPVSLYAATKRANELMAHSYSHLYGMRTTGLRFFTVYGPWGRPDMSPFLFARAISLGQPLRMFNGGDHFRDFTYIDDIVDGILRCIGDESPQSIESKQRPLSQVYNIGCSSPVHLGEFVRLLESEFGTKAKKVMLPMQPGDVYATYADVSALALTYGYRPNVSVSEGVHRFVNWYKSYYGVPS